jgi:outer membrane lipoprotein-sorting protein
MRRTLLILVSITVLAVTVASAQTVTVEEVLARVLVTDAAVDDFTADVIQNQGLPAELRGTAIFRKANQSYILLTEDGGGSPVDREVVSNAKSFTVFDNDAGTVVNRDLPLDPSNSDFRSLHRIIDVSPILHWRFLGGGTTAPVAGDNRYTLEAVGSNVDVRITVDTSLGAMVKRELFIGATLAVEETWSGFIPVGSVNLPTSYVSDYLEGTEVSTVSFSNFVPNQNPDEDLFRTP